MYIRNGQDLERLVLGVSNTEDLRKKFATRKPNFRKDIREVVSGRNCKRFPDTPIARSLYYQIQKYLAMQGVFPDELYLLPSVGTMVDLYAETDFIIYLKKGRNEAFVTVDLFAFTDNASLDALKDFWAEICPSLDYSLEQHQSNLFRFNRICSEFAKAKFRSNLDEFLQEYPGEFFRTQAFRDLWLSDYLPQAKIIAADPERGNLRFENHLVLTPQFLDSDRRKAITALIANLLVRQLKEKTGFLAS